MPTGTSRPWRFRATLLRFRSRHSTRPSVRSRAPDGCDAVRSDRPACARVCGRAPAALVEAAAVVAAACAVALLVAAVVPGAPVSPTTCRPRRPGPSSGRRAVRRDASARMRAIASSSALVGCSAAEGGGEAAEAETEAAGADAWPPGAPDVPPPDAVACTGSGAWVDPALPFNASPASSRSPSARRSRITLSGKKCSRCWRSTQRRRSTSWSKNLRYPEGERSGFTRPWLSRNRIFEIVTSGNSSRSSVKTSPIER